MPATAAVKEAALLLAVRRVVGRVQVQHDLTWRLPEGVQEDVHEQPVHRRAVDTIF